MKIIIGLGNPESKYDDTRHNVGFFMLDQIAARYSAPFIQKDKFKAAIAEITIDTEKILLVKPSTFYNDSGEAYRLISDFYKVTPEDTLIIHDELALPFGAIRVRVGGSDAGNNGIKSINAHGGEQTARMRLGTKNDLHVHMTDFDFVLGKFSHDEIVSLTSAVETVSAIIEDFAHGSLTATTHQVDV